MVRYLIISANRGRRQGNPEVRDAPRWRHYARKYKGIRRQGCFGEWKIVSDEAIETAGACTLWEWPGNKCWRPGNTVSLQEKAPDEQVCHFQRFLSIVCRQGLKRGMGGDRKVR